MNDDPIDRLIAEGKGVPLGDTQMRINPTRANGDDAMSEAASIEVISDGAVYGSSVLVNGKVLNGVTALDLHVDAAGGLTALTIQVEGAAVHLSGRWIPEESKS